MMSNHTWKSVVGGWRRCEHDGSLVGPVYPDLLQAWASEKPLSNHTPGPWKIGPPSPDINAPATVRADGWDVAHCFGDQAEGNARLIAAAPELMDFAEVAGGFIAWAKDNGAAPAAMDGLERMRRAAIAKAYER